MDTYLRALAVSELQEIDNVYSELRDLICSLQYGHSRVSDSLDGIVPSIFRVCNLQLLLNCKPFLLCITSLANFRNFEFPSSSLTCNITNLLLFITWFFIYTLVLLKTLGAPPGWQLPSSRHP